MHTTLLLLVLAQAAVVTVPVLVPTRVTPLKHSFGDGTRRFTLYESVVLVAESSPSDAVRAKILAVDPTAVVTFERPTMRIWKVRDAISLRAAVSEVRPAFHDIASGGGRYRVPMGLVCGGVRRATSWNEALEKSGEAGCLPDFWYPTTLR